MIKCFSHGLLDSNIYVAYDLGEAMIVDCGGAVGPIESFVTEHSLDVKYIVLTHGHYDHIAHLDEYARAFPNAEIACHKDELAVLLSPHANLSAMFSQGRSYDFPYKLISEGDSLKIGSLTFEILSTPGHTCGSICLICREKRVMLTGDTLFKGSHGRTDFPYGNSTLIYDSLKRLLSLDGDIQFFSGHYQSSFIRDESLPMIF